jgi:hypothetical protein
MNTRSLLSFLPLAVALNASACYSPDANDAASQPSDDPGSSELGGKADNADGYNELNLEAGKQVLYEVQIRAANACHPEVGSPAQRDACREKTAPEIPYRAEGMTCSQLGELQKIKLGTIEDMLENTADHKQGITVRYIREKVGATMIWLMPLFPNNDRWNIPDACDNLGSPYAVRDYYHVRGSLSRSCIERGADEYSESPCWGNDSLDDLIAQAHSKGLKVMLDVAFNHFGHGYLMYDVADHRPTRDRLEAGEDLERLWDYSATEEASLVRPEVVDTVAKLEAVVERDPSQRKTLDALLAKCPGLEGDTLVRTYHMYRAAFDHERAAMTCDGAFLEHQVPGFYLGANSWDPSSRLGDNFTNNWRDVKFLYHHEGNQAHKWEFYRQREYLFRIMNYWVSRGVDGFRLDHTTDADGGMGSKEWDYIISKVDYYAWRRGQERPLYLAEEFHDQMEMNKVVDIMTEGYVGDMNGRGGRTKDTAHVERVLRNMDRFGGHTFVMSALETHDEHRLVDGTGFDPWTGAGFWGIGATTRSTPMILMGQEFGEPYGLGFRKSDFLRSRFEGSAQYTPEGSAISDAYGAMNRARLDPANRALLSSNHYYLRPRSTPNEPDARLFAQAKWTNGSVLFVFHNLWRQNVTQNFFLPPDLMASLGVQGQGSYRLVDVLQNNGQGPCVKGSDLAWDFPIEMKANERAKWLRLEVCR